MAGHRRGVRLRHAGPTHLLIAGGGPAALEGALAVQRLAGDRVRSRSSATATSSSTARSPSPSRSGSPPPERFSLAALAAERGFELRLGGCAAIDPDARRVRPPTGELPYDALLLALGARRGGDPRRTHVPRAARTPSRLRTALEHLHAGEPLRVAFVAGTETAWTLPLYELALLTTRWARRARTRARAVGRHVGAPAADVFGEEAATAVADLLAEAGVRLWTGAFAEAVDDGRLWISVEGGLPVDLAVALPRPSAAASPGLPATPTASCTSTSTAACRAAGRLRRRRHDVAAAQAGRAGDAAGRRRRRRDRRRGRRPGRGRGVPAGTAGDAAHRRPSALPAPRSRRSRPGPDDAPWWPPHKIAGRELAPYLTAHPELLIEPVPS